MRRFALAGFVALLITVPLVAQGPGEFTQLFNGKDLAGWTQRGGKARYTVEDGAIVGHSVVNTDNTFLCTDRDYGNFILEYEFKVDPSLNSGVQVRSHCYDKETTFTQDGKEKKIAAGRVHGYQIEIDNDPKKDRWWTGGLYEEGRRGWLFPGSRGGDKGQFTTQGRQVTKKDEWNQLRIEANGPHLRTWLNGQLRTDAQDSDTAAGFIALQVHAIGKDAAREKLQVRWRNIKIQELK
jgi:hypothetical protein